MENLKEKMVNNKNWAVIGVSDNKEKMGYKIWNRLKDHGYNRYGVNSRYDEVNGEKIYDDIKSIPEKIDVVNMVVNPKIGIQYLEEIKDAGIEFVWFQPGTSDDEIISKAEELGLKYVKETCIYATLGEKN